MHLGTNTVDKLSARVDLLDKSDDSVDLGVGCIQIVVVDVELGASIGIASSLESNVDERLCMALLRFGIAVK